MMARRVPGPSASSPPRSERVIEEARRNRQRVRQTGSPPRTIWEADNVTNDPMIEAMRQWYVQPSVQWREMQRMSPTRYPETYFWPQEQERQSRKFTEGQRQATYTPTGQYPASRVFGEQQRQPTSEQRRNEAIFVRPTTLPPLSTMPGRDEMFRMMAENYLIQAGLENRGGGTVPTLYSRGSRQR